MRSSRTWCRSLGAAALATWAVAAHSAAQNIDLVAYRVKQDSFTVVLGALEVERPLGGERPCVYQAELRVSDPTGNALMNEKWREERGCPSATTRTLRTFEALRFAVARGRFDVSVKLYPENRPQEARSKSVTLEMLPRDARASDLILARDVGAIDSANSARWTIRYDGIGMLAEPQTRIAAETPKLSFYLEVYARAGTPLSGTLTGTVLDGAGKPMARMDLARISGNSGRARLAGSLSVAGLGPGQYTLETRVELSDTTFTRSARFVMDAPAVVATAAPAASGYFSALSDEELARLFDPLSVWLQTRQERTLYSGLNAAGRRQFLSRYFGPNGPTGNLENRLDMYLERVKRVNERFTERTGRMTQGWQTERGRVYLLRGEPANQVKRPFAPNDAPPYEIWSYNIGQQFVYVFIDESRLGHYRLVFSTDPGEVSLPDWQNRVGPAVIDDLRSQFGIKI